MADYRLRVHGVFATGRTWSTGRHLTSTDNIDVVLSNWKNSWEAAWTDATHGLNVAYPTGTGIVAYTAALLDAGMKEVAKKQLPSTAVGTNTGGSLPSQVTVVISWRSSQKIGKTTRGFQELAAPAEDQVVNDKLTGPAQARFSAALNAIKNTNIAGGANFFVYPRFDVTTHVPIIPAFTKTPVDIVECRDRVGSQDERPEKEPATYV